jgi:hypothetical protein
MVFLEMYKTISKDIKNVNKLTNKTKVNKFSHKNESNGARCLSKSILWQQMQDYYEQLGPDAWQEDIVPYQITSNKLLAHLYATLINAAIYDHYADSNSEPFYILELGGGHGKFSFYICKFLEFFNLYNKFNIIYIASDISPKNIEAWQNHPQLKKYIDNKQLDFAKFNAETDENIYLINAKKTITKQSLKNPLFVIANYVFDTLSHDAFKCEDNQLFATSIDLDSQKTFSFDNFSYKYSQELINENYYEQDIFNRILLQYKNQLKNGSFLLPIGALRAIENIKMLSKKNTVFLVADKGNIDIADFIQIEDPNIAVHGSVSFMVNFHALETFFTLSNGSSMITPNSYTDLQVACFTTANNNSNNLLTFTAKQALYDINPQNLINLCYSNDKINNWHNLDQMLAILSISKWDPDLFYDISDQLLEFIEKSINKKQFNMEQEHAITCGLELIWEYFFKLEKNQDLPFVLANIYYVLEEFDLALKFFEISIQEFGETVETWHNIALCYYALENFTLALTYTKKSLQINSKYLAAKKLLAELTSMV